MAAGPLSFIGNIDASASWVQSSQVKLKLAKYNKIDWRYRRMTTFLIRSFGVSTPTLLNARSTIVPSTLENSSTVRLLYYWELIMLTWSSNEIRTVCHIDARQGGGVIYYLRCEYSQNCPPTIAQQWLLL